MREGRDEHFIREALVLATQAIGLSDPNPRVGCVIADAGGRAIGVGHTQQAGGPHAEVVALQDAAARGESVVGATAYVTLEPCAHHGRTPPCCDALVAAGLGRVVVALTDPNPLVAGRGVARLRQAGIEVTVLASGELESQARDLNIGFLKRMRAGRPWVRLKLEISLDGSMPLRRGAGQRIIGAAAHIDRHAWRKRAGALLTDIGTVVRDDPGLDAELIETPRRPLRAIVDPRLCLSPDARILAAPGQALVYTVSRNPGRHAALAAGGTEIRTVAAGPGGIHLAAVLDDLGRRGVNELHVEAGARLNDALLSQDLVDELLVYMAPLLIGAGQRLPALQRRKGPDTGVAFEFCDVALLATCLRLIARRRRLARTQIGARQDRQEPIGSTLLQAAFCSTVR